MGDIYKAICGLQQEIGAIGKNEKNQMQKFNFRGIDTVYNEIHGLLAKHNVFSLSEILEDATEERQSRNGGNLIYRVLKIKYRFCTIDGSSVETTVIGEGMDSGDKASNKAMAIAHKYALLQMFTIPTAEVKDPDAEPHPPSQPKPKSEGITKKQLDTIVSIATELWQDMWPAQVKEQCEAYGLPQKSAELSMKQADMLIKELNGLKAARKELGY